MTPSKFGRNHPLASVVLMEEFAKENGYDVTQHDFLSEDRTYVLGITGWGEMAEAHFQQDDRTGYVRFHYGYIHAPSGWGDRFHSQARFRGDLVDIRRQGEEV